MKVDRCLHPAMFLKTNVCAATSQQKSHCRRQRGTLPAALKHGLTLGRRPGQRQPQPSGWGEDLRPPPPGRGGTNPHAGQRWTPFGSLGARPRHPARLDICNGPIDSINRRSFGSPHPEWRQRPARPVTGPFAVTCLLEKLTKRRNGQIEQRDLGMQPSVRGFRSCGACSVGLRCPSPTACATG